MSGEFSCITEPHLSSREVLELLSSGAVVLLGRLPLPPGLKRHRAGDVTHSLNSLSPMSPPPPVQRRRYVSARKHPLLHLLDGKREGAVFHCCRAPTKDWLGVFIYIIILNPETRRCLPEIADISA